MQFLIDVALISVYLCGFLLLCAWTWRFWVFYINQKYINGIKWALLEIKLPREIMKSPLATETAIASLLQGGGIGNWRAKFWLGNLPIYGSLEIASIEGVIHFYVRVQRKFIPLVESNFYAQYPGIEITEADDYTKRIRYDHLKKDKTSIWGITYKLGGKWTPTDQKTGKPYKDKKGDSYKMPADFLPIKTYVDYGLEKDPKEEFKIDPITLLLESMGRVGKGEHVWYQIMVQDEGAFNGKKFPKLYVNEASPSHESYNLSEMADARKKQIRNYKKIKAGDIAYDQQGNPVQRTVVKDGKAELQPVTYGEDRELQKKEAELIVEEKDEIEAINNKTAKPLACVTMRILYLSDSKVAKFNADYIQDTLSFVKPFAGANSFVPRPTDPYDYPWQNLNKVRSNWRAEELFQNYVEREGFTPHSVIEHSDSSMSMEAWLDRVLVGSSMKTRKFFEMLYTIVFHPFSHPKPADVFVLNTEEIATLWHLPGTVASTPTLPRIDSTKGVPPVNLPR